MVFRFIDSAGQLEKNIIIASGFVGHHPDYFIVEDGIRITEIGGFTGRSWSSMKRKFKLIGFFYDR
jgi:hypothetical protein